jgi:hypothetical protein
VAALVMACGGQIDPDGQSSSDQNAGFGGEGSARGKADAVFGGTSGASWGGGAAGGAGAANYDEDAAFGDTGEATDAAEE